ncbi:hypothetical protein GCM10028775_81530 [Catellatospora paridis]
MANTEYSLWPAWAFVESFSAGDGLAAYQLVGGVMAYQGFDG